MRQKVIGASNGDDAKRVVLKVEVFLRQAEFASERADFVDQKKFMV